jgi:hypothetical protein
MKLIKIELDYLPAIEGRITKRERDFLIEQYEIGLSQFYKKLPRSPDFFLSPVYSRNRHHSKVFNYLLKLYFLKKMTHGVSPSQVEIVLTDPILRKIISNAEPRYRFCLKQRSSAVKDFLKLAAYGIYNICHMIHRKVFVNLLPPNLKPGLKVPEVLLESFLLPSMIKGKKIEDRYYGNLSKYTEGMFSRSMAYLPVIDAFRLRDYYLKYFEAFKAKSNLPLLFKEDILNWRHYFTTFYRSIKNSAATYNCSFVFLNYDLEPLIKQEFARGFLSISFMESILTFELTKELAIKKLIPALTIDWNENQPIDRALNLGAYRFWKNQKVIGYQGFSVPRDQEFHLFPSEFEVREHLVPEEIYVIGVDQQKIVQSRSRGVKYFLGPALRFEWIHQFHKKEEIKAGVLCVLPILGSHNLGKLDILKRFVKMYDSEELHFKPHPSQEGVQTSFRGFRVRKGDFQELVGQYRAFVFLGPNSALQECLVLGVKCVVIGSKGDFYLDPKLAGYCSYVASAEELKKSLNDIDVFTESTAELREYFYSPVKKNLVKQFLTV